MSIVTFTAQNSDNHQDLDDFKMVVYDSDGASMYAMIVVEILNHALKQQLSQHQRRSVASRFISIRP